MSDASDQTPDVDTSPESFVGAQLIDLDGGSIGVITDAIVEDGANTPTWLTVDPGLLRAEHYLPFDGAYHGDTGCVVTPYTSRQIQGAPATEEHLLTAAEHAQLVEHYQLHG